MAGLVFALIAMGLTLIFGVMDVVNFAHGEFLMIAMYATFALSLLGLQPLAALPIVAIALFVVGAIIYRIFVRRLMEGPPEATIFGTFGLLVLFQGLAQYFLTSDLQSAGNTWFTGTLQLGSVRIGETDLIEGAGALVIAVLLYLFIEYTETGRAMRATSEDRMAAALMGVDVQRINMLAWGIGSACAGAAGALLMLTYQVYPTVGAEFALTAFVVVALGGFGSIQGAFIGALLVGLVEVLGGFYLSPAIKMIPVYMLYLIVVLLRPQGLLGRR